MTLPSAHPAELDLDGLIQSLPACKRCRDCRRGCDTLLPKCKQCTKAGVECIYYDHGRNEYLHRSYIAALVDHVRRLTPSSSTVAGGPSPSSSGATPQELAGGVPPQVESAPADLQTHIEHHFAYASDSYRYLGSESCLIKSPRLLATPVEIPLEEDDDYHLSWRQSGAKAQELVEVYLDAVHPLYPVVDLSARYLSSTLPADLTDTERFHLNMIYAIACHVMPSTVWKKHPEHQWNPSGRLSYQQGNSAKYRIFAASKLEEAMKYLEPATSEASLDTLRAVLLLIIHSLFEPKAGNIGQQVALATRLAMALESQYESRQLDPTEAEVMRNLHSTIFSIENEIASTLDRPPTFPEPTWDLQFDKSRPADYLCSLYRLQYRFRKGDHAAKESVKKHLPAFDDKGVLLPGLRMALHQTHLLLNPCWGSAWYVLEAVVSLGCIHIYLTPHWVYRAGALLIEYMPEVDPKNLIQLYANVLVVLSVSSWKWPSSAALSASLSDLLRQTKAKHPEIWADKTLQQFDGPRDRPPV